MNAFPGRRRGAPPARDLHRGAGPRTRRSEAWCDGRHHRSSRRGRGGESLSLVPPPPAGSGGGPLDRDAFHQGSRAAPGRLCPVPRLPGHHVRPGFWRGSAPESRCGKATLASPTRPDSAEAARAERCAVPARLRPRRREARLVGADAPSHASALRGAGRRLEPAAARPARVRARGDAAAVVTAGGVACACGGMTPTWRSPPLDAGGRGERARKLLPRRGRRGARGRGLAGLWRGPAGDVLRCPASCGSARRRHRGQAS